MRELVELVTEMPPDDADQARGHKMPFQATQLLTEGGDGVKDIVEAFFYSYRPKEPEKSETAPPNEDTLDLADPSFLGRAQDDSAVEHQASLPEDVLGNMKDLCSALDGQASPVAPPEEA
jgi:hypothetical protein